MFDLLTQLELNQEQKKLRELGLSEEEIEGYIDFFIESWFPLVDNRRQYLDEENKLGYVCSIPLKQIYN